MSWRDKPLTILPGRRIGPFELGQTRAEVQALTREPIESFYPQEWMAVRADDHPHLGVTVSYSDEGVANHIMGYIRKRHGKSTLVFEGELLREATRGTLVLLLELLDVEFKVTDEKIYAPTLGLEFGLLEPDEGETSDDDPCDYVVVLPIP